MTLTDNPIEAALKKALEVSKASPGIIPPPKSRFQQKKENLIPEFGKLTAPNEYIDPTTLNEPVDIFRQNQINREATKPEPTIKDDVFKYVDIFNDVISKVTPVDLLPDGVPGAGFVKDLAGKERRAEWFKNTLAPIIDNGLRVVKNVREGINPDEDLPGALLHTWDGVLAGTGLGLSLMPPLMLINAFTPQVAQYGGDTAEALGMPRNVGEEMGNLILLAPFGKRVIAGVLASETLSDFAENVLKDSDMTDEMKSRIVETVQHLGFFGGMYASGKTRPLEWKDGRLQVKESAVYNPKELRPVDPTPTPTVNEVPLLEPPKSSKLTKADEYLIEREPAEFDLMKNELDRAVNLENPKVEGVNYQKILDLLDVDMRKLEEQVTNPGLTPQERTKALKEMEAVDKRRETIKEKIKPVKLIENINPKPQENPLAKVDVSEIPTGVKAPELLAEEQRARELERQRAELEKDNAPGQLEELNRLRDMDFELRWNGTGRNISNPDYRDLNKRVTNFQNEAERVANESIPPSDKKIIESAEKEFRKEVQDQKAGKQPIVDIKIVSEENYRKALRDLKHKINRLNMSFGLDTIPELVVIGKYHLQRIPEYKAWTKEMIKEFGERVKPYLSEIHDKVIQLGNARIGNLGDIKSRTVETLGEMRSKGNDSVRKLISEHQDAVRFLEKFGSMEIMNHSGKQFLIEVPTPKGQEIMTPKDVYEILQRDKAMAELEKNVSQSEMETKLANKKLYEIKRLTAAMEEAFPDEIKTGMSYEDFMARQNASEYRDVRDARESLKEKEISNTLGTLYPLESRIRPFFEITDSKARWFHSPQFRQLFGRYVIGKNVVDVFAGSGILSEYAREMGAKSVETNFGERGLKGEIVRDKLGNDEFARAVARTLLRLEKEGRTPEDVRRILGAVDRHVASYIANNISYMNREVIGDPAKFTPDMKKVRDRKYNNRLIARALSNPKVDKVSSVDGWERIANAKNGETLIVDPPYHNDKITYNQRYPYRDNIQHVKLLKQAVHSGSDVIYFDIANPKLIKALEEAGFTVERFKRSGTPIEEIVAHKKGSDVPYDPYDISLFNSDKQMPPGKELDKMKGDKDPQSSFEKALAELKQVSRTLNSNPLDFYAKHFKNLTIVGLHYLKQGIKTLPEFTKKLTDTFGRGAKDFAVPLWNRTVSRLKEVQPKTAVNKFGDEHTPNSVNDHVNNAIKSIFQEYPELIHEMKVSPIQFRELSAKANKILQDIIEGKDSLSKYENQMTPTGLVVMRAHADYETRNALHIMDNVPMTEAGFQKGIDALNAATVAVGKANKLKSMTGQLFAANRVPIDTSQIGVKTGKVASPHEIKQGSDLVKQWEVLAKRATDFYSGKRVELHKQLKKLRKEKAPADQIRAVEDKIRFYGMQEKMYRDKLNELNKSLSTVSKSKRSKLYSAVALIRYNFLLSGIPTQMANIMGNFFNVGIEMGRLVTMGEVKPVVRSFVGEHPRESVTSMINYFLGKETLQGAKIVSAENQGFSSLSDKPSKVLKALDYTVNLPLKALGAADAAFYRFAYGLNKERQIADFQKTNKEAEPYFDSYERVKSLFERIEKEVPQDITVWEKEIINRLDEATRYAQLLTFRQPLKGQVPEGLQKISDSKIGLIVLPFVTTLINMAKMSGKYSPLPLIKLLGQEGREQYRQLSKLEKRDYNSRILIGTALTYGLAQLMANGSIVITGSLTTGLSMSANNDFRKTLQAQGIEPNQIGVKNPDGTYTTFTYTNLPVLNYILFALGAVSDQEKWGRRDEAQDVFTKVTKAGLNFISSMTQQTLLSSINYLFQAISNQNADYIYDSIISWILPSAVPQGLQSDVLSENPNVIDKSLKSPGTDFQKRLSRKLGNESDYYIPKRGIYGDVLEKSNQRFPLPPKTIGNDKVTNLLIDTQFRMNLRDLTDYKFVTQDADGTTSTIPMDKNDIDLFNQKVGQAFRIAMEDNYEDINSMSSLENKQKAVYSVLSEVADDVKKQMFLSKRNELTPESYEIYKFKKKSPINSRRAVEEVFK